VVAAVAVFTFLILKHFLTQYSNPDKARGSSRRRL
jgi:hypothetical protein